MRLQVRVLIAIVVVIGPTFLFSKPDAASTLFSKQDAVSTLVIGYALDEGSGDVASEVTGSNQAATLVNSPSWTSGRFGNGLNLDGKSQYLRIDSPSLPTGDFTWAVWINRRSNQSFQSLIQAQGMTSAEFEIDLEGDALTIWSSGERRLTTTSLVPANVWTHVALTRAEGVLQAYINGVADQQTGTDKRTLHFIPCPLLVGVDADSGCIESLNGYLDAAIDEIQLHSRALTADEIQELMDLPLGGNGTDTIAPVRSTNQSEIVLPVGTTATTISLTTNESATCRYALTANVAYADMSGLDSTGTIVHAHGVSGLANGAVRTHYIRCQDGAGNTNLDDFLITVSVAMANPLPSTLTFYVAPAGNDLNPGTFGLPFRTIERARQAVRGVNGSMTSDVKVVLRGGEYNLSSTLVFDQLDSGTNGHDVIYTAYPGERPVLHGGQHVTGWTALGGGLYKASVGALRFRQLYVNGQRAIRARTPNLGEYYQLRSWDTPERRLEIAEDEIADWQRLNQVEMVILGTGVNHSQLRISSVSGSGSRKWVRPQEPERTRLFQQVYPPKEPFRPYYFENALELLDTPGEWYLNTDAGEVYYMPRPGENLATADVVVPRLERLVSVAGALAAPVRHIQFRNLTFSYATWLLPSAEGFVGDQASVVFTQPLPDDEITSYPGHRHPAAVHVEAADDIVFERNVFSHLGSSGLNLYKGTHANRVVGNVFTDLSASGISVGLDLEGNPADSRQVSRDTVIQNNYLSDTGVEFYQSVGIMVAYGDGIVIEHNELSKMPYSGITVGWGWADVDNAARNNLIRYNKIENVLRTMSDGGGIYTLSRQPGTFIAENHVHDILRTPVQGGFNISGVYLDEGSNFITVRDNVLQNTGDRGIFQHANGPNNSFANNGGQSPATIAFAGLEPAYADIRPGGTPSDDLVPPVRLNPQPSGPLPAGTSEAQVSLSTDERSSCRSASTPGVSFPDMPHSFSSTDGTSHVTLATGLNAGGIYPYYVRCQDVVGNANNDDFLITVAVAILPPPPGTVATPVINPNGGAFSGSVSVTLSTSTAEASIRYTTDGTNPTAASALYTAPLTITSSLTIRAVAFKEGLNDSAVAAATFIAIDASPAGLVGAFGFSEGAGTSTRDTSSNANVGVLTDGVTWTTQGMHGSALSFDGANGYVEVSSPDLPTGDFTWLVWLNALDMKPFQAVMMGGNDVSPELAIGENGRVIVVHGEGQLRTVSTAAIQRATWTHVALTRSGNLLRIYLDGVEDVVDSTTTSEYSFGACPLLIGVDSDSGCADALNGHFTGTLDEVRIFNRALSASEIQQEMSRP